MRLPFVIIGLFLSLPCLALASAEPIHDSTGPAAHVKRHFMRLANSETSVVRRQMNRTPDLAGAELEKQHVSVVMINSSDIAGGEDSGGTSWSPEHESTHLVFVGYRSSGRGSSSGTITFECKFALKGADLDNARISCRAR